MNPRIKARLLRLWRNWGRPILAAVIVVSTFRSAVADWNDVPTGSMKPTILEGDRIFVNKLAYDLKVPFTSWRVARWTGPQRGDIVVFFSPEDEKRMVKRVIGLPGDVIALQDNRLIVNGKPAAYDRADAASIEQIESNVRPAHRFAAETLDGRRHAVMATPGRPAPRTFGPVTVPADHYFMMGDNRDNSADSRWFGFVQRDRIVGRSGRVVLSFDPDRWYVPRWGRFFRGLE